MAPGGNGCQQYQADVDQAGGKVTSSILPGHLADAPEDGFSHQNQETGVVQIKQDDRCCDPCRTTSLGILFENGSKGGNLQHPEPLYPGVRPGFLRKEDGMRINGDQPGDQATEQWSLAPTIDHQKARHDQRDSGNP
jgi:hypothetical protein